MAQDGSEPAALPGGFAQPAWKTWFSTICATLLAIAFLVAGVWKLSDPLATTSRMIQVLIPVPLATAAALSAGIFEVWAAVLLLVPRWRRWGAILTGLMLVAFIAYMGIRYNELLGADCSCFPFVKRVVGPMFFVSNAIMLLMAGAAWFWARASEGWRNALIPLAAVAVFAGVVYGASIVRQHGLKAPDAVAIDGKPESLQHGRVMLYFFDPQCAHCFIAAKEMATYKWVGVKVIAVPTVNPQWAQGFLDDTAFKVPYTTDSDKLREVFKFTDPPYGVLLEHGRQVKAIPVFEGDQPSKPLKELGWIE